LYYPTKWWHATENVGREVIGAVGRHINADNYDRVFAELMGKCDAPTSVYSQKPDDFTCAALRECLPKFRDACTAAMY
jgi:hypothetical protein